MYGPVQQWCGVPRRRGGGGNEEESKSVSEKSVCKLTHLLTFDDELILGRNLIEWTVNVQEDI